MTAKNKFSNVSMNGRMAYIIMCCEKMLITKYPSENWKLISQKMWNATSEDWGTWTYNYNMIIPDVLLSYNLYSSEDFSDVLNEKEFYQLKCLYKNYSTPDSNENGLFQSIINAPFEFAMIYEGTEIGDGRESLNFIVNTEQLLLSNNIVLPDYTKVSFSSFKEKNGWGNNFDGTNLSIILN